MMDQDGPPPLAKTADEFQIAHDTLAGVILGETPMRLTEPEKKLMAAQLDVLCWALGHDHNVCFAKNLSMIRTHLEKLGCVLKDSRTGKPSGGA